MSTLIITLPPASSSSGAGYAWARTPDGRTLTGHGHAPADLLPPVRGEIVAVVPAAACSWHTVELPKGVGPRSPRLRQVLESLLEERLLDEPEQLHLALDPAATAGGRTWVAACNRAWLHQHLLVLDAAQHAVSRIVPEFAPEAGPLRLHVLGDAERAELVATGTAVTSGVLRLPLSAAALSWVTGQGPLAETTEITAEPAVGALTEDLMHRPVRLQPPAERSLAAARSGWDLAQFDVASSGRSRALKRLAGLAREWRHAPQWRAARWGALALVAAQLVGLNAWALKEQAALAAKREAVRRTLTDTFPAVKLVVDAPAQMEREVATLRQATGSASGRDLEFMLGVLGSALPAGRAVQSIDYGPGETRVKGLGLSAEELTAVTARLGGSGYSARSEGDTLTVRQEGVR